MEKCESCGKEAYFQKLCRKCFAKSIEKRVSRFATEQLKKNDTITVLDDNSGLANLTWHFIKLFAKKVPCCIGFSKVIKGKAVIPVTMDHENSEFLELLAGGYIKEQKTNEINLLKVLTQKECRKYAEIKKINFDDAEFTSKFSEMLNNIEKKYPGRKKGLLKSSEKLKAVFRAG